MLSFALDSGSGSDSNEMELEIESFEIWVIECFSQC